MRLSILRYAVATMAAIMFAMRCTTVSAADEGRRRWCVELFGGTAHNFHTPLKISQSGAPGISLSADYATSGTGAPYYMWRVSQWTGDRGWELEGLHHKLDLRNRSAEIQNFQISHGFNMFMLNRAWMQSGLVLHAGAGIVVTHAENTVRGQVLDENGGIFGSGYRLSGAAVQFAAGKRIRLTGKLFATGEGALTVAYVQVPVNGGHANLSNIALHGLIGLGYEF